MRILVRHSRPGREMDKAAVAMATKAKQFSVNMEKFVRLLLPPRASSHFVCFPEKSTEISGLVFFFLCFYVMWFRAQLTHTRVKACVRVMRDTCHGHAASCVHTQRSSISEGMRPAFPRWCQWLLMTSGVSHAGGPSSVAPGDVKRFPVT